MKTEKLSEWFYTPDNPPPCVGYWHTGFMSCDPRANKRNESAFNWWWDGAVWRYSHKGAVCVEQNRWYRGLAK